MKSKYLIICDTAEVAFVEVDETVDTLQTLQVLVNGRLDYVPCQRTFVGLDCWFNDEFSFYPEMLPNIVASYETNTYLQGLVVIARSNEEGKTISLTSEDVKLLESNLDITDRVVTLEEVAEMHAAIKAEYTARQAAERATKQTTDTEEN